MPSSSSRKPTSTKLTTQSKAKKRVIIDLSNDEEDIAFKQTAAKVQAVSPSRAGAAGSGAGAGGSQRNGSRKGFNGFFSAFGSSQTPRPSTSALPSPRSSTSKTKTTGPSSSSSRNEASTKKKGKQPEVIVLSDDDNEDAIDGGPPGGEDVQDISDFDMHEPDSFSSPLRKAKRKEDGKGKISNKRNGKATDEDDVKGTGVKRKRKDKDTGSGSGSGSEDWELEPLAAEMWTDLYAPKSVAELAPSKSRITLLRNWLEEAVYGRPQGLDEKVKFSKEAAERVKKYRRVLLLTGPAGAAKSTSVRVVAEELGLEIMEWTEGFEDWGMGGDFERESLSGRLLSFLSRNTYGSLDISGLSVNPTTGITSSSSSPSSSRAPPSTTNFKHKPRILLITSLPNLSHYPTRQAFNQALLEFASTYSAGSCPLVVVVPDVGASGAAEEPWSARGGGGGGGGGEGGWDLRSVVGEGVIKHPAVTTIDFLSVAPTFIIKALKRILPLAVPQNSLRPPNEILTAIAQTANGDLRSAINSLEMMMKSGSGSGIGFKELMKGSGGVGPKKGKGSRGGKGKASGSKEMRDLLNRIATREQSLGLFHALGKVLYNKRIGDPDENGDIDEAAIKIEDAYIRDHPLPAHLLGHTKRRYENDFDTLIGSVPTDTASFMLWLQQNLPQFCVDIDQLHAALDGLGDADGMKADDDMWQRSLHAIAYAFHVAVRGCVASLPHPVPRKNQKIYKPEFFGWIKATKENKLSLETAGVRLIRGKLGVSDATAATIDADASEEREENRFGGQISKHVLATEFMPMLRLLQRTGHDMPIPLDDAFQHFPYNDPNDLDILNEKDEPSDMNIDDQEDILPVKEITRKMKISGGRKKDELDDVPEEDDDLVAGLQGTATYLMADDIVED